MFLFTFQECSVVRGVLIHWLVPFLKILSLSPSPSVLLTHFTTSCQSNPPLPFLPLPSSSLTHFLLSKEEALDYLTPPVWASHLPIFLPVDHQPARVVMEGEIRSTSPRQLLFFPLGNMHGAAQCDLRRTKCHSQLFSSCFRSVPGRGGTTQEQLFSRRKTARVPSMLQFLPLSPPFLYPFYPEYSFSVQKSHHEFLFPASSSSSFSFAPWLPGTNSSSLLFKPSSTWTQHSWLLHRC